MDATAGNPNQPSPRWHVALVALPVVLVVGWIVSNIRSSSPIPFDAEAWRGNSQPMFSEPLRFRMAKHIASSGEFIGKTETELHALLDADGNSGRQIGTDRIAFAVRYEGGSDYAFVQFDLDSNRRVVRVIAPGE